MNNNILEIFDLTEVDKISIDSLIMDNIITGLPYLFNCLKRYIKKPDCLSKKYLLTYISVYLLNSFTYNVFLKNINIILSFNKQLLNEYIYEENLYQIWVKIIYKYILKILYKKPNLLLNQDYINAVHLIKNLILEDAFFEYLFKKEISNKVFQIEYNSLIGILIENYNYINTHQLFSIIDILKLKTYQSKNLIIEWMNTIFTNNNIRCLERTTSHLNTDKFMLTFIELYYDIWYKYYSKESIKVDTFSYNLLKIIDITIIPIINNYKYYQERYRELNELIIEDNRNLMNLKTNYNKKIINYENLLVRNNLLFSKLNHIFFWIINKNLNLGFNIDNKNIFIYELIIEYFYKSKLLNKSFSKENINYDNIIHFCIELIKYSTNNKLKSLCLLVYFNYDINEKKKIDINEVIEIINHIEIIDNFNLNDKNNLLGLFYKQIDSFNLNSCSKYLHFIPILLENLNKNFINYNEKNILLYDNLIYIKKNTLDYTNNHLKNSLHITKLLLTILNLDIKLKIDTLFTKINQFIHYSLNILLNFNKFNDNNTLVNYTNVKEFIILIIDILKILTIKYDFYNFFIENFSKNQIEIIKNKIIDDLETKEFLDTFLNSTINTVNINIPDEFLDPLLCTLINTPVCLPISNIIIDRKVIEEQLTNNPQDPFSRDSLDIDTLNTYNERDDIKLIIQNFIEKKKIWLLKNKPKIT